MMRLDKLLAARAAGTRTQVRKLVRRGQVTVDGEVVHDHAMRVGDDADVRVEGELLEAFPKVALFHKPAGAVSTMRDDMGRLCLADVVPPLWHDRLHPVGRLDADTTGLLPFSADGAITQHLLHPKRGYEREYIATVDPAPQEGLAAFLASGVRTADGVFTARVVSIEGADIRLVVTEGRHRMVRRMLANSGHPVVALHRLRFGPFVLGDVAEGDWRAATPEELSALPVSHRKT